MNYIAYIRGEHDTVVYTTETLKILWILLAKQLCADKNSMNDNNLHKAFGDLINKHWSFLDSEWPTIEPSKYHRTS